jgi:cell division protein FtsB/Mg-chelatase subunit ChlD
MKSKLVGIILFTFTLFVLIYYPQLAAKNIQLKNNGTQHLVAVTQPVVDVVFVLDTTGSMSGLIQTAKDKIWSIANTMASAKPTPKIRIGLVAYRDIGDQYVTRVVDLSDDLDSVYSVLMDFEAAGGGDTPESVNRGLYDAVYNMSWSQVSQAYQAIFLVGDAPPHMNYNEVRYPEIAAMASARGIVINTIQCGDMPGALEPWTQIASLGNGRFLQVEQAGGAVIFASPYDEEIAKLSARLDDTRLYYGNETDKASMQAKVAATAKLNENASLASRARRGGFNVSSAGETNLLGNKELVEAISSGALKLDDIDRDALPEELKPMAPAEQQARIAQLSSERQELKQKIRKLSEDRSSYLFKKVEDSGGAGDSLDRKLFDLVKEQASKAGLEYEEDLVY